MYKATVVQVKDADTYLLDYEGVPLVIRLGNVDAPEKNTPFGKEATQYVRGLIEGKEIGFEIKKFDNCGRHVCNVYIENQRLDEILVSNGYAWHWEKYSDNKDLVEIEKEAYYAKKGIGAEETLNQFFGELWHKQASF